MKRQLFISTAIFILLGILTTLIILFGRGYRFGFEGGQPQLSKTGLLVAKSEPDGAQVYINGNLTTATDNTLNLIPGEYTVKIAKDGYFPWEKKVRIQEEVVTKAEALLLPTAPKLESITTIGVMDPVIDPSGSKLAYKVASQSARKNGVYVFDMNANIVLSLQGASRQIADETVDFFSSSSLVWSPDGEELMASTSAELPTTYLLNARALNDEPRNVTVVLDSIQQTWLAEKHEKDSARTGGLKLKLRQLINQNFNILSWSPDDTKILYTASRSADLPLVLEPRLIGIDTLRENRKIEEGKVYVYDTKEDTNFKVLDTKLPPCEDVFIACKYPIMWHPDSAHLIAIQDEKINVMDHDGTNSTTVYAGPFVDHYVFPWPNGSKLVILTNLNNLNIPANLYTISLK